MLRIELPMSMITRVLSISVGYFINLLYVWVCIAWIEVDIIARVVVLLSGGFLIGASACRHRLFTGRSSLLAICACLAALTLWLPIIIATYGFALLGTPVLAIYGLVVKVGGRTSEKHAALNKRKPCRG